MSFNPMYYNLNYILYRSNGTPMHSEMEYIFKQHQHLIDGAAQLNHLRRENYEDTSREFYIFIQHFFKDKCLGSIGNNYTCPGLT